MSALADPDLQFRGKGVGRIFACPAGVSSFCDLRAPPLDPSLHIYLRTPFEEKTKARTRNEIWNESYIHCLVMFTQTRDADECFRT